jgi:hypothetical protein
MDAKEYFIKMLYMNKVIKEDVDKKINGKTLLMYMNYLLTGNTLFINTRKYSTVLIDIEKINMIKYILNEYELELAKNYNTYKNTLLNIKMSNKEFKTNINRITKLSKKVKQKNYAIKYDIDNLMEYILNEYELELAKKL